MVSKQQDEMRKLKDELGEKDERIQQLELELKNLRNTWRAKEMLVKVTLKKILFYDFMELTNIIGDGCMFVLLSVVVLKGQFTLKFMHYLLTLMFFKTICWYFSV